MLSQIICFNLVLFVISIKGVLSGEHSIICKDSNQRIDSITYADDIKMYFVAIGNHFWWAKERDFPLKDKNKLELPNNWKKTTAAVYIDTRKGCPQSRQIRTQEKEIYITDMAESGDTQIFMARDTATAKWRGPFKREEDHCLHKALVDFDKPIDAMFALNYLEIFFVQGEKYSMVDCKYICTDRNKFGTPQKVQTTKHFLVKDPIHAMFTIDSNRLFLFSNKVYYELKITGNREGMVTTEKSDKSRALDIQKDFMKLNKDIDCNETETPEEVSPPQQPNDDSPEPPVVEETNTNEENELNDSPSKDEDSSATPLWLIILMVVIAVIIVILCCCCICFVFGAKKTGGPKANRGGGAAAPPKTVAPVTQKKNISALKK